MSKTALEHFDDIRELETGDSPCITVEDILPYKCEIVWKSLKALEIIKRFIWVEDGKLKCGRFCDIEIELDESDFESKEQYERLKEVLE